MYCCAAATIAGTSFSALTLTLSGICIEMLHILTGMWGVTGPRRRRFAVWGFYLGISPLRQDISSFQSRNSCSLLRIRLVSMQGARGLAQGRDATLGR